MDRQYHGIVVNDDDCVNLLVGAHKKLDMAMANLRALSRCEATASSPLFREAKDLLADVQATLARAETHLGAR